MKEDAGYLFRLHDVVADKWSPLLEYPSVKSAIYGAKLLKLPPYLEKGDYELVHIGYRNANDLNVAEPNVVWVYNPEEHNAK